MSKNKKIISLSIDPDLHDTLIDLKKKRGESVSKIVTDLVERFVGIAASDEEIVPVVLKIPAHLREDPESMQQWLDCRTKAVIKCLCT